MPNHVTAAERRPRVHVAQKVWRAVAVGRSTDDSNFCWRATCTHQLDHLPPELRCIRPREVLMKSGWIVDLAQRPDIDFFDQVAEGRDARKDDNAPDSTAADRAAPDNSALSKPRYPPELLDALARVYARAAVRQYFQYFKELKAAAVSPVTEAEPACRARKRQPRVLFESGSTKKRVKRDTALREPLPKCDELQRPATLQCDVPQRPATACNQVQPSGRGEWI